ncbi:uncharacterized protein LOC116741911 [Phocoena sinus]|uniref:uncharacterized protein LOC116741911 n=1 Tax=Phocoena sinus TaxID=42100 RepID=UPI0013C4896D|nr:uncharacterized protein LOC116741911 [Phocoena sinus]
MAEKLDSTSQELQRTSEGDRTGAGPWRPLLHLPAGGAGAPHQQQSPGQAQGGKRVHRGQECDPHGVERPGRQAGEAGGKPGACLPGQGPLRPPHIPGHLQGFPYHPADAGPSLHKVCPQDSPCDAFLASSSYGCILPYSDEDGGPLHQLKMAVSSMLGTWLHHYPEHFHQPPEFPRLKMLLAYTELSMPGSDLEQQAHLLLAQLEHLEPPEAEGVAPAPEEALATSAELEPATPLLPATAPEPEQVHF